jgi:hypothetical protein
MRSNYCFGAKLRRCFEILIDFTSASGESVRPLGAVRRIGLCKLSN